MNGQSKTPYLIREVLTIVREYNPEYGDNRVCLCGHPYKRHFDSYDNMEAVGCKYCDCDTFHEKV